MSAVVGGGAGRTETEAGDDLVEDEQGAVPVALLAQRPHELGALQEQAGVGRDPLDQDRGDRVTVARP